MASLILSRRVVAAFASLAMIGGACAETVEDFYKKKSELSVYVGSGAGGGFDEIARIFSLHFARRLPGQPNPVVKNMPGAGGLLNVNFMYAQAPRDGSAIAAPFNTVFMLPLFGDPSAKFDARKFTWIGSLDKQTGTCVVWHTSNINSLEDASKREVQVGATGVNATPAIFSNLMNTLFGTRFKVISGYTTNEMRFALERGETEGVCGLSWQTYKAVQPGWIANKQIRTIAQMGLVKHRDLPDVPLAIDLLKNPTDRKVFELVVLPQEFGRPFIAPPDVPADRAAAMRQAFAEVLTDPAFLAEARRLLLDVEPMKGEEVAVLVKSVLATPPDVVARVRRALDGK